MLRSFYAFALGSLLLSAGAAQAQSQVPRPTHDFAITPADLAGDAARQCATAHIGAAQRRPSTTILHRAKMERYDVKYYKLDLALENNSRDVAGSVWMRVRVRTQAIDSLAFELYQGPAGTATLLIDSVVINGRRSPGIRRIGPDATAALAQPAAANSLLDARIYYHGTAPNGNSSAIGNAFNTATRYRMDGVYYPYDVTWSLSEPFSAHEWFPCKQVLTDKADSSDVWVTTTLPNKVGSNGVLSRTVTLPNNKVRYEWKSRHPIAYYLISVAVAPYIETVSYANPAGGPRIPIVDYVYDQNALSYYQTEINRTAGFIENYSGIVGLYPFANEKYGHSMAPIGGGMEHQTMTTQDGFDFTLTAHELFHQWFGNNVTCGSWEDIWLNESFASYGEYMSLQVFSTPAAARSWMDTAHQYALSNSGSVYVPDTTSVGRIFNYYLTYKKGAGVVHMLRYLLQDDTKFYRALRTYQSQYANSTARTADMQRIFEAEAGRSLTYFFQQWFRGQGYPSFDVRWNQVGGSFGMRVSETTSEPGVTPFFDTDVDYRLTFSDGSTRTIRVHQDQPTINYSTPVAGNVTNVEVDPDQWILNEPGATNFDASLTLASRASAAILPLQVYPNPCREQLLLQDLPAARATAEVLDVTGRVVLRQVVEAASPKLHTTTLAPGIYGLRLLSASGERLAQGRFVRE
ncbi:M1 family aminopeptidase [Hymenobacter sp. ASUV-10]|uniref:Aminopeptidase N n=1 Tax=Hymenobacter aranciens TaxID=3063996 RepID=A0ABT9B5L8_9BACT|nr:M1 family aminopeptidase [Hymenobacter sp. ASUV-10]MDO7873562.1 M1 family aminopeptidase [Hymenobacter sp. ASUV-10]